LKNYIISGALIAAASSVFAANDLGTIKFGAGGTGLYKDKELQETTINLSYMLPAHKTRRALKKARLRLDLENTFLVKHSAKNMLRATINATIDLRKFRAGRVMVQPYLLGGAGFEAIQKPKPGLTNGALLQIGAGINIPTRKARVGLFAEAKKTLIVSGDNAKKSTENILIAGVSYSLGRKTSVAYSANSGVADSDFDKVIDQLDKCPSTPNYFSVDAKGCPLPVNMSVAFHDGSAQAKSYSASALDKVAAYLKAPPRKGVILEGHTNSPGRKLSGHRANTVKAMLTKRGVNPNTIYISGKGDTAPVAPKNSAQGEALNNRIIARFIY